jgi:hypothetical protein
LECAISSTNRDSGNKFLARCFRRVLLGKDIIICRTLLQRIIWEELDELLVLLLNISSTVVFLFGINLF